MKFNFLELEQKYQLVTALAYARLATYAADLQLDLDDVDDIKDALVELGMQDTHLTDEELDEMADEIVIMRDFIRGIN